jgi:hypothetical protein
MEDPEGHGVGRRPTWPSSTTQPHPVQQEPEPVVSELVEDQLPLTTRLGSGPTHRS